MAGKTVLDVFLSKFFKILTVSINTTLRMLPRIHEEYLNQLRAYETCELQKKAADAVFKRKMLEDKCKGLDNPHVSDLEAKLDSKVTEEFLSSGKNNVEMGAEKEITKDQKFPVRKSISTPTVEGAKIQPAAPTFQNQSAKAPTFKSPDMVKPQELMKVEVTINAKPEDNLKAPKNAEKPKEEVKKVETGPSTSKQVKQ